MVNKILSTVVLLFTTAVFSPAVLAESGFFKPEPERPYATFAFEFQAYPTGIIPGFTYERFISKQDAVHLRVGMQTIRHEDFGVHDDERGDGFGGTLGYRRYWPTGLSLGARVDLWANSLDWADNIGEPNEQRGHTDVLVLQPVVEVTWRRFFAKNWFVQPSAAAGAEINIRTEGEETGQGFIFLFALAVGRSF